MTRLGLRTKIGYGCGHILNDLCSAMWFTYLLLYFHQILRFDSTLSGVVLLTGQVADALSTPFVGRECDRSDDLPFCLRYGRRKTWHLVGIICVLCSFPFIFMGCFLCSNESAWSHLIYFLPLVVIFQFGWATTQISHLALLPHLTEDPNERTELNAIRYGGTVGSTITVYIITWLVLGITSGDGTANTLGTNDVVRFRYIVFAVLSIGILFTVLFHTMVSEVMESEIQVQDRILATKTKAMTSKDWLRNREFYHIAVIYMCTRLFCNLSQVYIPLYLQITLMLNEESVAYIPLVMYVSGLATTSIMKPANKWLGRKMTYLFGVILGLSGAIWIFFGHGTLYRQYLLYIVAVLLGSGGSTMLVTALSITADLIGQNKECGGFIYGCMSFTDKLSNGIVVMIIQALTPPFSKCEMCRIFYKQVLSGACSISAIIALLALLSLGKGIVGNRSRRESSCSEGGLGEDTLGSASSSRGLNERTPLLENSDVSERYHATRDITT